MSQEPGVTEFTFATHDFTHVSFMVGGLSTRRGSPEGFVTADNLWKKGNGAVHLCSASRART